jgi:acylphosphatase
VQGVYFRENTRREAQRRAVRGWVRNLSDGRVEAVFEGERNSVEAVVEWCRVGPPDGHVERLEVKWEEPQGSFSGFEVTW